MIEIVEKFVTISGEAPIIGVPIYLIRLSSCNLDCIYCDTKFNSEVNFKLSINQLDKDINHKLKEYPGLRVLITGGEPLIGERQQKLLSIFSANPEIEFYIETNGTVSIENTSFSNVHFVVDWKTPSSGFEEQFVLENLMKLRDSNDCIKFVVAKTDLPWLSEKMELIKRVKPKLPVFISPQWDKISNEEIADYIINNKLNASMSIQLHKIIWGPDAKGV